VTLRDVVVRDNRAALGGGIWTAGSVILNGRSRVVANRTTKYSAWCDWCNRSLPGGGIYVRSGRLTLNGRSFVGDNTAQGHGGGVYLHSGALTLNGDSRISDNTTVTAGGGVYNYGVIVDGGYATVALNDRSTITRNVAVWHSEVGRPDLVLPQDLLA
jgi:hypothetical protein